MSELFEWASGVYVTKEDFLALQLDVSIFGTAYVEKIGPSFGKRIDPQDIMIEYRGQKTK